MTTVHPEEVAIFVDQEQLRAKLPGERPFPLQHDGFAGADDPNERVLVVVKLVVEGAASFAVAEVGGAVDAGLGREAGGEFGVAGDEVDADVAPGLEEGGPDLFDEVAGAAFDEQDAVGLRDVAGEEIAHQSSPSTAAAWPSAFTLL